ncbi:MAG TPA: DUF3014 domain-containing protein [Candidatus Binatia bacterium]
MGKKLFWAVIVIALAGPAAMYLWMKSEPPAPQKPTSPVPAAKPAIRHPIETDEDSLSAVGDTDNAVADALAKLLGPSFDTLFNRQQIVRRIVATIDNLPRETLPLQSIPVKSPPGSFLTSGTGESLAVSPENASRYLSYVRLAEVVPVDALVRGYKRFYPIFQAEYQNLGYPDKYFNDRLVEVIDHLLATPDIQSPVLLTQPNIIYQFADPKLERLSAGQKIMLRIGSENAAKIKAKLHQIREALVSTS